MSDTASRLVLPEAPSGRRPNTAVIWSEPIWIDSYMPMDPEPYPSFFRNRVYQGSSGRVYPLPFHERVASEKSPRQWQAVHLENDWMRVVVLPELGGRIHVAYDKRADYDIFYRNNVIKPALVGLAGPWISGGVEFNWPQHHRPATFLPTDFEIVHEPDGSVVVWCSDHDPFARMKGMHGVRLRPDSSRIEVDVRLYNRDDRPQTFLWWANVAAAVNDEYQSFFPPDVHWVADHAKRAIVTFPSPNSPYYGVDSAARRERLGGDADRIDWYRNIPVPTSYMAMHSEHEYFGGYDHGRGAGFVHWAPREISPGKKQWTWGDAPFGHAWDANLTDTDGPYVELMAGVYTDNQPDFAYLAPGETKTFRQVWYPIREIGPAHAANDVLAASLQIIDGALTLGVVSSEPLRGLAVHAIDADGTVLSSSSLDLDVDEARRQILPRGAERVDLETQGHVVLSMQTAQIDGLSGRSVQEDVLDAPAPAHAPPAPADVSTIDELVYIATYLTQYRHATRSPRPYWDEALRRDPGESRAQLALGWEAYDHADYRAALAHLESSISRQTAWTPTPRSGEAHYAAALAAERLGDLTRAKERYARAGWDAAVMTAANVGLARLHLRTGDVAAAERLLRTVVTLSPSDLRARNLLVLALRSSGREADAADLLVQTRVLDPLDAWSRHLGGEKIVTADATIALDVAIEYASAGRLRTALEVLDLADRLAPVAPSSQVGIAPLIGLHRAALLDALAEPDAAAHERERVDRLGAGTSLASRLDDIDVLRAAVAAPGGSAVASLLLGNWQFHVRDADGAMRWWQRALDAGLGPQDAAVAHRNIAVAAFNRSGDGDTATAHYSAALSLSPDDSKLLFEQDQLTGRLGLDADSRLAVLEAHPFALETRDDLLISWIGLLIDVGRLDEALDRLTSRHFQPWEGGEGLVVSAWERVCIRLARQALEGEDVDTAERYAELARSIPSNLGEDRHPLANVAPLELLLGDVEAARGRADEARAHWERAAESFADFSAMAVTPYSAQSADSIAALVRLGRADDASRAVTDIREWLERRDAVPAQTDFFATSLPTMLLFDSDPESERRRETRLILDSLGLQEDTIR